jgi:hypothetical protein
MSLTVSEAGGYEAFTMYHALKLHFSGNYDYVKYNGKTNVTKEQFMVRKDKFSFYKLSRKYKREELFGFYVANFLKNPKLWAGDLLNEDAESEYKVWLRIQQSLGYLFDQDISHLFDKVEKPDELLIVIDGQYPLLYNEFLQDSIHLETIIILNDYLNFLPMWSKKVEDDIVFPDFVKKCNKYKPFFGYDKVKFKNILKDKICQNA